MKKPTLFARPEQTPPRRGWYLRQYPLIVGLYEHPCPWDWWDGKNWLAGMPDNQGIHKDIQSGQGLTIGSTVARNDLPWIRANGVKKLEVIG